MLVYRGVLPPEVAGSIAHLPPGIKRSIKGALRALMENPAIGDALHSELEGCFKYRARRYRIVFQVARSARTLRILAVGHRRNVYEELAEQLKKRE